MKPEIEEILQLGSLEAAPFLLGHFLCRMTPDGLVRLRIVETEAYHQDDPASHSFIGLTKRTAPMFEAGGRLYVYFTYGMHYCLNIVVGRKGVGEAVLLRAAEPIDGIDIMAKNRRISEVMNISNGPGKLAQAIGITDTSLSGKPLDKSTIYLEKPAFDLAADEIIASPRIGISQAVDLPWRFYIKDNPYVSKYSKNKNEIKKL